jgi:dihydrodipicolinate synthase/N-acetylneuraminate lyase
MAASDAGRLSAVRRALLRGLVIPAHPLALTEARRLDERRQVALTRYYCDAGAGGIAVGVHTTQFAIRDPAVCLLAPVLDLAIRTVRDWCANREQLPVTIAGVCGPTAQALREAELAVSLGYDAALLSLGALRDADTNEMLDHCRRVADVIPVVGFYLQPAVGGRVLDRAFWRGFLEIDRVVAVKVAPFDRYRTMDVAIALAESGRTDVALYTGNDDAIVADLLTPFPAGSNRHRLRFVGGLLGQWAVWTRNAVDLLDRCLALTGRSGPDGDSEDPRELLALGAELTDVNAALFDPRHQFAGCIPGIHEVLRRQGLLAGRWCLDPHEELSPGQMAAIDRVLACYAHLADDSFVSEHLDGWMA